MRPDLGARDRRSGTLTALQIGHLLARHELDAAALCEAALERSASPQARHAFIALTERRARAEAQRSARRLRAGRALGPLDGVPVAWKDLFDVAGTPTTAGSATRRDAAPAPRDAAAVRNLAAAGMVCIGKTNLTEFAYSGLGLNPHFGTPLNPFGRETPRIPGGSSSGAAVAVAVGVVPCAIGTDTSGSVRVPAAFCGLVGFKPSASRIPRDGVFPLAPTLDSVGPIARSVADVVALDATLRGVAAETRAPEPLGRLHVVVPAGEVVEAVAPAVAASFDRALSGLRGAGVTIERRRLPVLEETQRLIDAHGTIVAAEASKVHAELLRSQDADRVDRRVLARLRSGAAVLAGGYDVLIRERLRLSAVVGSELGGALLAFPTVRHTAPELEPLERDDAHFVEVNRRTLRNTMLTSYLDMPGVALPIGADADGLPTSLLVSAPSGDDDRLLRAALSIEAALDRTA